MQQEAYVPVKRYYSLALVSPVTWIIIIANVLVFSLSYPSQTGLTRLIYTFDLR